MSRQRLDGGKRTSSGKVVGHVGPETVVPAASEAAAPLAGVDGEGRPIPTAEQERAAASVLSGGRVSGGLGGGPKLAIRADQVVAKGAALLVGHDFVSNGHWLARLRAFEGESWKRLSTPADAEKWMKREKLYDQVDVRTFSTATAEVAAASLVQRPTGRRITRTAVVVHHTELSEELGVLGEFFRFYVDQAGRLVTFVDGFVQAMGDPMELGESEGQAEAWTDGRVCLAALSEDVTAILRAELARAMVSASTAPVPATAAVEAPASATVPEPASAAPGRRGGKRRPSEVPSLPGL